MNVADNEPEDVPPDGESRESGEAGGSTLAPLPGEHGIPDVDSRRRLTMSKKGLLALALVSLLMVAVVAVTIQRFAASGKNADDAPSKLVKDRPAAATADPRRLDMVASAASALASGATPAGTAASAVRIPALTPTGEELADPIGVRRRVAGSPTAAGAKTQPPEDAPIMLVTTRPAGSFGATPSGATPSGAPPPDAPADALTATSQNLQGYQRQLQGLLDNLTKTAALATGQAAPPGRAPTPPGATRGGMAGAMTGALQGVPLNAGTSPTGGGLFGGQLQGSSTPKVAATLLGNRSLTLPKGTAFTCALKTKVISATSGLVGCQVQRNVFSDDGRVLLIERGSHLDGEYRIASVRPGTVRIPVLWTRVHTPLGVTVELESPGTGPLGESGIPGHVDNRWMERIGAAMLLSLIDDAVQITVANQQAGMGADTVVLPSTTANTSKLAEKVLDSTINIPPLIYQNQGGIVGIYVARDVDFSSVYELQPTAMDATSGAPR